MIMIISVKFSSKLVLNAFHLISWHATMTCKCVIPASSPGIKVVKMLIVTFICFNDFLFLSTMQFIKA